ncbi:MAG: hypothetical protein H6Q86_4559 [candidate division NC10 bacterium]|nr:hypothetical protein [candidate division NC10 bacterium]
MREFCIVPAFSVLVFVLTAVLAQTGRTAIVTACDQGLAIQGPPGPAQTPAGSSPVVTEELIAEKDPSAPVDDEEDVVSRDGRKAAWRTSRANKWAVMLNGERQAGEFDEVHWLIFSRDGQHFAFRARSGKTWLVVLDAQESPQRFDEILGPVFSPDGVRLAYAAKRDKKWFVVVDSHVPETSYDKVELPLFSQDGRHVAFCAKRAGKWVVISDGKEVGPQFDELVLGMFSPDGQRLAYVGRRGGKWMVALDGKEGPPLDLLGGLAFSSDSRRFSYAGADVHKGMGGSKARGRVVVDGEAGPEFEGNAVGTFLQNLAAGGVKEIVLGYHFSLFSNIHGVTAPVFSADGSRVAYAAHRAKDDAAVIVDGQPGPKFPSIVGGPVFSADGRHVAYVVSDEGVKTLVVDGERVGSGCVPGTDFVFQIVFAPDNRRVGYIGVNGGSWYEQGFTTRARRRVYVDGKAGAEYQAQGLAGLRFSPDSRHVTYVVHRLEESSRTVSFVVVDTTEGKRYDYVIAATLNTLDDGATTYVAQAGRKFLRVTQPVQ